MLNSFLKGLCFSFLVPILISWTLIDCLKLRPFKSINLLDRSVIVLSVFIISRQIRLRILEFTLIRKANSRSARLAPLVQSRLPFGISLLLDKLKSLKYGEPSDLLNCFRDSTSKVVRLRSCGIESLLTLDHRDAQYILSNAFSNFGKSPTSQAGFKRLLGEGVFLSDQRSLWAWHRHLTRPHFARDRIQDLVAVEQHSQRLVKWLSSQALLNQTVNIQDVFARFTLTVGTQHLFGRCVDSLNDLFNDSPPQCQTKPNYMDFAINFANAQTWAIVHATIPPFLRWIHPRDQATDRVLEVIDSIIQEAVDQSNQTHSPSTPSNLNPTQDLSPPSKYLLDHLLSSGCSTELVRHECLNILLAATDTMSSLLTSCIYELGKKKHGPIYLKLKEEILRFVGDRVEGGGPGGINLTLQQVREMKFLRAVINETLRLHPPVWANSRHAFEDDVLPSGVFIPAGTDCRYIIREIQRNPDVWGPDAEQFDPERWIDDRKKFQAQDPFSFQPFSAGPRICLGQQFAYTETSIALIRIIERFNQIELESEQVSEIPGVILKFRGGMKVKFIIT